MLIYWLVLSLADVQIHTGAQQLDEASWSQYCAVKRGSAPESWLRRLSPRGPRDQSWVTCPLTQYQETLIDRLKVLSSWMDESEPPTKLPIDKFQSTEVRRYWYPISCRL